MGRYDYSCEKCDITKEVIAPMDSEHPKTIECPGCGGNMEFVWPAVAVATSNMENQSVDIAVGRDADARWQRINERQAVRDRVREESGMTGLTATGVNEYVPLSIEKKFNRTDAMKTVEKDGFKAGYDTPGDKKIVEDSKRRETELGLKKK